MSAPYSLSLTRRVVLGSSAVLTLVAIWVVLSVRWAGASHALVDDLKLPGPALVVGSISALGRDLTISCLATFSRVVAGLVLGGMAGVILGLWMSQRPVLRALLDPLVEGLRPIPPFALAPFVILWVGLGFSGQLFVVALACFMVMVVSTTGAIASVERKYILLADTLGADSLSTVFAVIVPSITPSLIAAARVAAGTAVGIAAASEYLGAQEGLGYIIRNARTTLQTEAIVVSAACLGIGSALLDSGIRRVGVALTRWQDRSFSL